ncbi:hypothetical protein Acr_26g0006940 [Actinidia rufa]|uniref:Ubiquitin-like protease family profile domain-containing protein n=1 Tax=Actinidia rufa TaxID=165716 RepID=A0A7J0H3S0_9ERIC|nr:hypothetical protein Acr_26g0006940 [Actinidia rufa]
MTKSNARQPRVPACRRAHRKKKRRQKDEETSEPEVVCPSLGRERSKKRVNCDSDITPQQGNLDTHMFQCYLEFVLDIYKSEGRPENEEQIYGIPLKVPKVPQQRNRYECGNFVLYYLNLFAESAPESFSISEGYPYFMKEDWFSPEGLACFCQRLDSFC